MNRISRALRLLLTGRDQPAGQREIPPISPEEVAEARRFFPMTKFFIFGHARSGTTLLARLVRLHPDVHCNYQAHFFTRPPLLSGMLADQRFEDWLARRSNRRARLMRFMRAAPCGRAGIPRCGGQPRRPCRCIRGR